MAALLAQLDRVPDRADAHDPLEWDGAGLPK
jgi:antitoxin VapB